MDVFRDKTFLDAGLIDSGEPAPAAVSAIRSFPLAGPAGKLEALLNEGDRDADHCALVLHPHPLGGGSMHNKVVYHAAKVLSARGWPVLRFNFRGTGLSEGLHHGKEEVEDALIALEWLTANYDCPVICAGFSFGAAIGLRAASLSEDVVGFAALGLPTHAEGRDYTYPFLPACPFPKLFLSGDHDQYAPAEHLRAVVETAPEPKQLRFIEGANHFFVGHLSAMQAALAEWLSVAFPRSVVADQP